MQRTLRRLIEGLVLVGALAIVVVISSQMVPAAQTARGGLTATLAATLSTHTAPPTEEPSETPSPRPTSTSTPGPTATPPPTSTPTDDPTPTPPSFLFTSAPEPPLMATTRVTGAQALPVPTPMPVMEQPDAVRNILLLGSDQAVSENVGNTDTLVVVSIDPAIPAVSTLSIPRDYYAWIPGHGFDKINTAFGHGIREDYPGGGSGLLKATIEYNLGIRIHYFALVGFDSFVKIVDAAGGVDVAVECPLSDTFPDPDSPSGQTDVDWAPGIHHLDGKHALWYARSRWSTTDFDRHRRQQQVLRGLYRQIVNSGIISTVPQLWETIDENVITDLGLADLIELAEIAAQLDPLNVRSRFLGWNTVQAWTAPNGSYVLVPYSDAIGPVVEEALAPPATSRAQRRGVRVEVWNGTGVEGLGHVAAERLRWEGFQVAGVTGTEDTAGTQIVDFTTTTKGSAIYRLLSLYRLSYDAVASQPTEERGAEYRVILGADYDPCAATRLTWFVDPLPTPTPLPTLVPSPTPTPMPPPTPEP